MKKSLGKTAGKREKKPVKSAFMRWMDGEVDLMENIYDVREEPDRSREEFKRERREKNEKIMMSARTQKIAGIETRGFYRIYTAVAVSSCILLIGVLLFTIANLPRYGVENPVTTEVVRRYTEKGLEETGAVNIVAGMILDYRAFDTLGESHVLFTALICVMILLRIDSKNMQAAYGDYYRIRDRHLRNLSLDPIMRKIGLLLVPCIFVYGIYVILNGQNGPGGGFSGGTVLGSGLILLGMAVSYRRMDDFYTARLSAWITFCALSFYSFAKGYVFFTGANGLPNHIPKGKPGAILSGGLILPLDIAVGLVVACTMFGLFCLFRRGRIGRIEPLEDQ